MAKDIEYDAVIVGGGLAGLTVACRLGQAGVTALCIDAGSANPKNTDLRTTAISAGSQKILEEAGIWQNLPASPCPINDIEIFDGKSPLLLNFSIGEVAEKQAGEAFGWIVLNADLRAAMLKTLGGFKSVMHLTDTSVQDYNFASQARVVLRSDADGTKDVTTKLVIGADGRQSFTRKWMEEHQGVRTRTWSYKQRAVICTVGHDHPHNNVAVEHFWPEGPFAILPMADGEDGQHRSSLVFTEHGRDDASLMNMSDEAFELAMAAKFPECYGGVRLIGKRVAYPLGLVHASTYIAPRMALVADAAHGIHPIAGQGLNLGFRDVKTLADLIQVAHERGEDIGDQALLQEYQRVRRPDNMSMVAVTDGLNRLFSNNIKTVGAVRRFGLKAVSKLKPVKRFFINQASGV